MGVCKRPTSVSFDEHTRELVEKARRRYAPMLDESFSAAVRFIIKQHDSLIEVLLARKDMMLLMIEAQQQLVLNKFAQVPAFPKKQEEGPEAPDESMGGVRRGTRPLDGFLGRKTPQSWSKDWTAGSGRPV